MIKFLYQLYITGEYMGAEQLQGIPWYPEQMHKTCKDGSVNIVYITAGRGVRFARVLTIFL